MKRKPQNAKSKTPPRSFNVCVVTGTRAEFGIWRPVLRAIQQSPLLSLQLVATGMHLLPEFGNTHRDITREKFPLAARAPMYKKNEPPAKSLARGTENLAATFRKLKPNLVMLLGDRLEMLAAASAALAERIPIAHLHGGESALGIWDEQIRHAITKMAHLHFCATTLAKKRILQMGEDPTRIHQVGAPALDAVTAAMRAWKTIVPQIRLVSGTQPLLLLHPSSDDDDLEFRRTNMLVDLLVDNNNGLPIHALGPNNDPGHRGILRAYETRREHVHLVMSLTQEQFWLRLISAGLLIGNSSAGIIEAATFGIPVINIGDRQKGRERNPNVIDAPFEPRALRTALRRATSDKSFLQKVAQRKNLYGNGNASKRIITTLEKIAPTGIPLEKHFTTK